MPIHDGDNLIGRGQAPLFDADAYLSPRHAELVDWPERRDDSGPAEPERRVPEDRNAKSRWSRATSSASARSCCASR